MRRDGCFGRTSLPPVPDKMRLERGNALLNTKEKPLDLREKLEGRLLVGDSAMGTLLADRESNRANLNHAHLVRDLHEQYLRAGARVIETNTFSANKAKLAAHNLEEEVRQINLTGARLACEVTRILPREEDAFVLGAIGPLGRPLAPIGPIGEAQEHGRGYPPRRGDAQRFL